MCLLDKHYDKTPLVDSLFANLDANDTDYFDAIIEDVSKPDPTKTEDFQKQIVLICQYAIKARA